MLRKITLLNLIALIVVVVATSSAYARGATNDFSNDFVCGAPKNHDNTLKLLKQNLPTELPQHEMVSKGYLNSNGVRVEKTVGTTENFWVVDDGVWTEIEAKLVKINDHAYVFVQTVDRNDNRVLYDAATSSGYISSGDAVSVAREFHNTTSSIYNKDRETFGVDPPTGVDGDTRITILLLDIDSDYADYVSSGEKWWTSGNGIVAGYFYSVDTFSDSSLPEGYHSNERKIIYIDTYPLIEHGVFDFSTGAIIDATPSTNHNDDLNATASIEGASQSYGTLAHEFQHMIHYYHDSDEETWLNEGCAGFAEFINGYGHPSTVASFVADPTNSLVTWNSVLADYGSTYLFTLYLYEQYGGTTAIKNLVADSENGSTSVTNMTNTMGYTTTFKELVINWFIANYYDSDLLDSRYKYTNLDMTDYGTGDSRDGINSVSGASHGSGTVGAIGAEYVDVDYNNKTLLTFTGSSFTPVIVKIKNSNIIGITTDTPVGSQTDLAGFGSSYDSLLLIAGNTSPGSDASYTYSFSDTEAVEDVIEDKNKEFLCYIATASYGIDEKPPFFIKVLRILNNILK